VEHAATLPDQPEAGRERLRARGLLEQAWELGNTSALAMNLAQLLKQLPESGAIKFSDNPQVEQAMRAGEAAFSRRDFDQALRNYSRALELEPKNYTAALFIANTYDKQNQLGKGAEWYERAIQLDPNVETGYRYYADMLAKAGDMAKARRMLIEAAVAEPYNRMVWRELHAWATLNNTHVAEVFISVPPEKDQRAPELKETSTIWQAYRDVRVEWRAGGKFGKAFPGEKEYRHSLPEESEALTAAARVLDKLKSGKKIGEAATTEQSLSLLTRLYQGGFIEAYVLFSLGDAGIARDYESYRAKNREKLKEYMDQFVVPAGRQGTKSGFRDAIPEAAIRAKAVMRNYGVT
jgi:tetratricopeptide (TPR) repeat protein